MLKTIKIIAFQASLKVKGNAYLRPWPEQWTVFTELDLITPHTGFGFEYITLSPLRGLLGYDRFCKNNTLRHTGGQGDVLGNLLGKLLKLVKISRNLEIVYKHILCFY